MPQVVVEEHGHVRLSGELDLAIAPELCDALVSLVSKGGDLVVDLADVEFIDGQGLRPLLLAAEQLDGRGHVVLTAPSSAVARVLRLVNAELLQNLKIAGLPNLPSRTDERLGCS
jgi:anti-anti-sigma factor